jgi:hypothetical protein
MVPHPNRMRALNGLALDLASRQQSTGYRCLLTGVCWIMLALVAMQALSPAVGSGASMVGTAVVQPVVSTIHAVTAETAVRDPFDAQPATSESFTAGRDHHASTSMQVGDDVDPDDDGGLTIALTTSSRLVSLPVGALAPRLEPRRPLGRTEAPPDRPPTSAA